MNRWTVLLDLDLLRHMRRGPGFQHKQLAMIERLLVRDGPAAFVRPAKDGEFDVITAVSRLAIADFPREIYRLRLEIFPGRTVIVREATHFDKPDWT